MSRTSISLHPERCDRCMSCLGVCGRNAINVAYATMDAFRLLNSPEDNAQIRGLDRARTVVVLPGTSSASTTCECWIRESRPGNVLPFTRIAGQVCFTS